MEEKLSSQLVGKKVRVTDIDGEIFDGVVGDYIDPEDNDPEGTACIVLDDCPQRPGMCIGFDESEMASIEIIR